MNAPVNTPEKRLVVIVPSTLLSLLPAIFCKPSLITFIPYISIATEPISVIICRIKFIEFNIYDFRTKKFDFFLPLYISKEYDKPIRKYEYKWDLAFVGTGKPEKIQFLKSAIRYCEENDLKALFHIYLPSKLMFMYNKLFRKEYKGLKKEFFKFNKLNHDEIKSIYAQSRCVLDSGSESEGGLPLRVFEILGLNKKLISVNKSIENYAFYRKEQFCVCNNEFKIDNDFFKSPLPPNDNIDIYRINNWASLLINPQSINIKSIIKK